jgi:maintenance of mitochondrial morphology protein 1
MGEEYPIFSNVRIISSPPSASDPQGGRLQALVDVDLSDDNLTLAIETSLLLNYPKALSAQLPVALSVSVVRFSATLSISFVPATDEPTSPPPARGSTASTQQHQPTGKPKTNLAFSFLPDYRLDLSVRSLIGSRSRLQDIPKIAQLVEARAQSWFEERVVEPRVQVVPLPGMWPRMGKVHVRDGTGEDGGPAAEGAGAGSGAGSGAGAAVSASQNRSPKGSSGFDAFPSQEEAESLVLEGIRRRGQGQQGHGQRGQGQGFSLDRDADRAGPASSRSPYLRPVLGRERASSQVIVGDDEGAPGPSLRMPGGLSA